jgi:hypothetical protein
MPRPLGLRGRGGAVGGQRGGPRHDGKWVLRPGQIETANQASAPLADDYSRAEASRKMPEAIVARGNPPASFPRNLGRIR